MTDSIYKKNRKRYLLLMLPALLLYTFTLVIPLLGGTLPNSLTNWNLMKDNYAYVGFKNYIWLFSSTGTGLKRLTSSLSVTFGLK